MHVLWSFLTFYYRRAPLKARYLLPYNDNFAWHPSVAQFVTCPSEALAALLEGLPLAEIAIAGHRVRLELERDVKMRAVPCASPPRPGEEEDVHPPRIEGGGAELRATLWPEKPVAGSWKKALLDWQFHAANRATPADSDSRFAPAYAAAIAAGRAAWITATGAVPFCPQRAFVNALRAAAASLRTATSASAGVVLAQAARAAGAASGLPEAHAEDFVLAARVPSVAEAADAGVIPSGGSAQWIAVATLAGAYVRKGH